MEVSTPCTLGQTVQNGSTALSSPNVYVGTPSINTGFLYLLLILIILILLSMAKRKT